MGVNVELEGLRVAKMTRLLRQAALTYHAVAFNLLLVSLGETSVCAQLPPG